MWVMYLKFFGVTARESVLTGTRLRWVSKLTKVLVLLCVMGGFFTQAAVAASEFSPPQPNAGWVTTRAVDFRTAYTIGWEPHYGAFFPGSNGRNQHFLGSGGDAATCGSSSGCIGSWGWWGNYYHVLLVPKGNWLLNQVPWVGDRWQKNSWAARHIQVDQTFKKPGGNKDEH